MKIIEAIQERIGPQYATLPDAIGWYEGWPALHEDYSAEFYFKAGKRPVKEDVNANLRRIASMEERILRAWRETHGEQYQSIGEALVCNSRAELLDCWLEYEGISGYTSLILRIMEELGYEVDSDE